MAAVLGTMAMRTIGIQLPPNRKAQFAALAAAALVCAVYSARAESRRTIVFFGDSITAGYGLADPAAEAYPALIQTDIASAHHPRTSSLSR